MAFFKAAFTSAVSDFNSDSVRLLLTRVAREKKLPFEPLIPNKTTIAAMKEARREKLPRFVTVQDLLEDLHADD